MTSLCSIAAHDYRTGQSRGRYCGRGFIPSLCCCPAPYFEFAVRKSTTFDPTVTTLLSNNRDREKTNITEETLRAIHKNPWLDTA
jgi:hypothetical protein